MNTSAATAPSEFRTACRGFVPAEFRAWVLKDGGDAAFYAMCGRLSYAEDAWKDDGQIEAFLGTLTEHEKAAILLKFAPLQP